MAIQLEVTREEAAALLQIANRASYKGEEVMHVAVLMQKLNTFISGPTDSTALHLNQGGDVGERLDSKKSKIKKKVG